MPSPSYNSIDSDTAASMLRCVPAVDRDIWLRIGMAIQSEFGNEGWSLFDDWSQSAHNYIPQDTKSVWRSFQGSGVTIGTLIYLANQYGYKDSYTARPATKPAKTFSKPKRLTSDYAKELYLASVKDDHTIVNHPYAIKKGIYTAAGAGRGIASGKCIGKDSDCLVIPIRNIETNKVQGVQVISPQGEKQTFGQLSSGALILGNRGNLVDTWYVAEGWASAVSVVFHHGKDVCACSFGKSNQDKVAGQIAAVYQPRKVRILREDDQ